MAKDDRFFTVEPEAFERQLSYLKKNGLEIVKLSRLLDKMAKGQAVSRSVVLSFDDGYRDNYATVFPLLKKYGFQATIFVVTGSLGKKPGMMSESQIREMQTSGLVEFMPHSRSHHDLDRLPLAEAAREIEASRDDLEMLLGGPADIFAYPRGRFTPELEQYLRSHSFRAAVTVEEGLVTLKTDPFRLPRNSIDSTTTDIQFRGKVSGAISLYVRFKAFFKPKRHV